MEKSELVGNSFALVCKQFITLLPLNKTRIVFCSLKYFLFIYPVFGAWLVPRLSWQSISPKAAAYRCSTNQKQTNKQKRKKIKTAPFSVSLLQKTGRRLYWKRDFRIGVFLRVLWKFQEVFFKITSGLLLLG